MALTFNLDLVQSTSESRNILTTLEMFTSDL